MATAATAAAPLLPPEDLAHHAQTLEVLFAMWSGDGEVIIDDANASAVEKLTQYLALPVATLGDENSQAIKDSLPSRLVFALVIDPFVGDAQKQSKDRKLELEVTLLLRRPVAEGSGSATTDVKRPRMSLRTPAWMSRKDQEEVSRQFTEANNNDGNVDDDEEEDGASRVMAAVEVLSEAALDATISDAQEQQNTPTASTSTAQQPLPRYVLRTWHHLPSLSTKEKRDDLVSYAQAVRHPTPTAQSPGWPLTGFVLAGKPGLVVLECSLPTSTSTTTSTSPPSPPSPTSLLSATQTLDSYWSSIKSRSWSDIPSGHKKVSETLREEGIVRAFEDMREVTGSPEVGGREAMRGGWRNDMAAVEGWLRGRGVGGRLREVLGADW